MLIATVSTIISLIFLIAFVAAMIILQVYLSRRESKLPGLVLPAITFSGELFILLNVVTNVVSRPVRSVTCSFFPHEKNSPST